MTTDAHYRPLPKLSPYTKGDRYSLLKEDHKYYIQQLQAKFDNQNSLSLMDVGCGNGEMINQFKLAFPTWDYSGTDFCPEFIEAAKNYTGLKGVDLKCCDFLETEGLYDIVFCSSVIQIFTDIQPYLQKLLSLCKPGGVVFVDGLFNKFDIDVRLQYCDSSNPEAAGKWRVDWNQHSQKSIERLFASQVKSLEFIDVPMDLDMPLNENMPINRYTFRDNDGKNRITNGTNVLLNRSLLIAKK
jgi:ubiquinone/menaquinone biosynthesis C-methylase UbiE